MIRQRLRRACESIIATREEAAGDWQPHHWATFDTDVDTLIEELGRESARPKAAKRKPVRTNEDFLADPPEHVGKGLARNRSGGDCEARTPWCLGKAREVHHRAGRGFYGQHHPDLLLHVCGHGNVDGCHGYIEQHRDEAMANGWRLPWGTKASDLPGDVDHRPVAS